MGVFSRVLDMAAFAAVPESAPKPSSVEALTDTQPSERIDFGGQRGGTRSYGSGKRDAKQDVASAFDNYRCVPELAAITINEAKRVARCRYIPKVWDANEATYVDDTSDMARETLAGFVHKGTGSFSRIVERLSAIDLIAGDVWLVGEESADDAGGWVWSIVAPTKFRTAKRGGGVEMFTDGDWRPFTGYRQRYVSGDPEDDTVPDAPGLRLVQVGRQIRLLDAVIDSWASMSMHGGILKVPSEFMVSEHERVSEEELAARTKKFKQYLSDELMSAAASPGSVDQLAPMVLLGISDKLQHLELLEFSSDVVKWASELRESNVKRLGRGFDAPQESMTGKNELSHWTSANVDQDRVRNYTIPRGDNFAEFLTAKFYRPWLQAAYGLSAEEAACRLLVCDPAVLLARADMQAYAVQAYDRDEFSGRELVRAIGADPDQVMPTEDEKYERRIWQLICKGHVELAPLLGLPEMRPAVESSSEVAFDDVGPSAREVDADMPEEISEATAALLERLI